MKKFAKTTLVLLAASLVFSSCMGSFAITKKLYSWNEGVTGNKFVNNLLFWILSPVYGAVVSFDAAILNLIEFWTGSNPLAFSPEFEGTDRLAYMGKTFELTNTGESITIGEVDGDIVFAMAKTADNSWALVTDNGLVPMFKENNETVVFYTADQSVEMAQNAVNYNPFNQPVEQLWAGR